MDIAKERSLANRLVWGAAAGAAGSAALNIVTYGDMLRGRPSSGAPAKEGRGDNGGRRRHPCTELR
jgi:hypothetical protein